MSDYSACPGCGRKAQKAISSSFFPVLKCAKCGHRYCKECGGTTCPKCGDKNRMEVGKVRAG